MLIPSGTFELAKTFINSTNRNVLLTGKAGTGKTTLLKHIYSTSFKNTAVVAPTGVAAINASGSTIHSFFSLPFHPFIPGVQAKHDLMTNLRLTAEKKQVLQSLELLIIDEISMVRCDILDSIDVILRVTRSQPHKPFGGVQLLLIGDLYQLPPVIKPAEWELLKNYYPSQYFFNSHVIRDHPPVYIELDVVFRQKDPAFITLLNQVRNNELDQENYERLHSRLRINHTVDTKDIITLTTHNEYADKINKAELKKLPAAQKNFPADVEGNFLPSSYPADLNFEVKEGARVMFIKNDLERVKRFYNGKTGVIKRINEDGIIVTVDNDTDITVKKETWKNVRYTVNKSSGKMEEEELGSFRQYPLRLAWAITIHKSQGLTFDQVLIDAASAFAPGQVYVALSRCRSLEGLFLTRRIETKALASDPAIVAFAASQSSNLHSSEILIRESIAYRNYLLLSLFDLRHVESLLEDFTMWLSREEAVEKPAASWIGKIKDLLLPLEKVGVKFIGSISELLNNEVISPVIQERIGAAIKYFSPALQQLLQICGECDVILDNRKLAADFSEKGNTLYRAVSLSLYMMEQCSSDFSVQYYFEKKKSFGKSAEIINAYENKTAGSSGSGISKMLFDLLVEKRNELAAESNKPRYLVISTASIEQMSERMPLSLDQLSKITGFGTVKLKQYGKIFLDVITGYCESMNLSPDADFTEPVRKKKERKPAAASATKNTTYELFVKGKSVREIAAERNLAVGTIEGHLAAFIQSKLIKINELVPDEKVIIISKVVEENGNAAVGILKEKLPACSYADIRYVSAYLRSLTTT